MISSSRNFYTTHSLSPYNIFGKGTKHMKFLKRLIIKQKNWTVYYSQLVIITMGPSYLKRVGQVDYVLHEHCLFIKF